MSEPRLRRVTVSTPHPDYEIHARHGDWISSVYRLYAADGKRDVVLDLKVDKKTKAILLIPADRAIGSARAPEHVPIRPIMTRSWRSEHAKAWSSVHFVAGDEAENTPPLG